MIQANELRVGNLLKAWFNTNNGFEQTVIGISPMVINEIYHGVTDYEPIPITEEWLLRFGFSSDCYNDRYYIKGVNYQIECDKTKGLVDLWIEGASHVKSVHDLQNYHFALTGEELKLQDK